MSRREERGESLHTLRADIDPDDRGLDDLWSCRRQGMGLSRRSYPGWGSKEPMRLLQHLLPPGRKLMTFINAAAGFGHADSTRRFPGEVAQP